MVTVAVGVAVVVFVVVFVVVIVVIGVVFLQFEATRCSSCGVCGGNSGGWCVSI